MENNQETHCSTHNEVLEYYCFNCNKPVCSTCCMDHHGHTCEHFLNITEEFLKTCNMDKMMLEILRTLVQQFKFLQQSMTDPFGAMNNMMGSMNNMLGSMDQWLQGGMGMNMNMNMGGMGMGMPPMGMPGMGMPPMGMPPMGMPGGFPMPPSSNYPAQQPTPHSAPAPQPTPHSTPAPQPTPVPAVTPAPVPAPSANSKVYILSAAQGKEAHLFDVSNKDISFVQSFKVDYDFYCTNNSLCSVGEEVYCFGGRNNPKKYCVFNAKTKSFTIHDITAGCDGGYNLSVCYDGKDHIYILNGSFHIMNMTKVDRFNIRSKTFESFVQFYDYSQFHCLSLVHNNHFITLPRGESRAYYIDLNTKKVEIYNNSHLFLQSSVLGANDGAGNIYIQLNNTRLERFNVVTRELAGQVGKSPKTFTQARAMHHHRFSASEGYIYHIGEGRLYRYSIESAQWAEIGSDVQKVDRQFCGASLVSFNL
ncbi:hypothetical protein PPL_02762 [Heterostelium album PN500]|uniref:B box-type domain-containing protein n=1 Tax=Heterostelium pallidum (strain ATCC 26659 / Pp 5 / PN500) TaxID=670386 RepID=D3B2Z7_HETP5|nr:hypothetical protein PPL_02762 [Heterostelium album PN500]EFA83695.1 hypothetical protein PPL_02762 [Heterostelium album PN500]|eukprot:XP_020435812.1 hypothetical protein PPL_02762 [Heterostelium album PN500]